MIFIAVEFSWEGCWSDVGFPELLTSLEGKHERILDGNYWERSMSIQVGSLSFTLSKCPFFIPAIFAVHIVYTCADFAVNFVRGEIVSGCFG